MATKSNLRQRLATVVKPLMVRGASFIADATRTRLGEPADPMKAASRLYIRRVAAFIGRVPGVGDLTDVVAARMSGRASRRASQLTTPATVLRRETVESLAEGAEDYFRQMLSAGGAAFLKRKPFHDLEGAPVTLYRVGQMLHGAYLARGLHVLDYGGGAGWVSAALWQMGCNVVCVDASASALAVAREVFSERRALAVDPSATVHTVVTDGRSLPLPAESIDRVLCYDAFHHIPNQEQVLREFFRVLRRGGLVAFAEPGRHHSATKESQGEMVNYRVLENDIRVEDLWTLARKAGFSSVRVRPFLDLAYTVDIDSYLAIVKSGRVGFAGREALMKGTTANSIFYLHKGPLAIDSRWADKLGGRLTVDPRRIEVEVHAGVSVTVTCTNTGVATWLRAGPDRSLGVVNIGLQLCSATGEVLSRDWRRVALPRDVVPGETVAVSTTLNWEASGTYTVTVDLVSEGISWFGVATDASSLVVVVRERRS